MIDGGEPGQIVNTSSGDGGFAPGADGVGVRRVEGGGQLLHRVAAPQPRLRGHGAAGVGLLPVRRAAAHRPVHRQPATGPSTSQRQGAGTGRTSMTLRPDEGRCWPRPAATSPRPTSTSSATSSSTEAAARRYIIARDLDAHRRPAPPPRRRHRRAGRSRPTTGSADEPAHGHHRSRPGSETMHDFTLMIGGERVAGADGPTRSSTPPPRRSSPTPPRPAAPRRPTPRRAARDAFDSWSAHRARGAGRAARPGRRPHRARTATSSSS